MGIPTQLKKGIRFLDIRCRLKDGVLEICHGEDIPIYMDKTFAEVIEDCKKFLKEHSSECIIMSVKKEGGDSIGSKVEEAINKDLELWYLENELPSLDIVRGKIVLFRRFEYSKTMGIDASEGWEDNSPSFWLSNGRVHVQDKYKVYYTIDDINKKWEEVKKSFDDADDKTRFNELFISFTSGSGGIAPVDLATRGVLGAKSINDRVYEVASQVSKARYGIIVMDFAAEDDGYDYDGNIAGDYVFEVPLILPEPEDSDWFSNGQQLKTRVTVTVAKGTPKLTVAWDGTAVNLDEGLSLTYGDVGELEGTSTNPDGRVTFTFDDGEEDVLDLTNPEEVAVNRAGTATLTVVQEETDNYEEASLSLEVTVAPKAITIVPTTGQGKVYGEADPDAYGYALAEGKALAFDDRLTDIVSATDREAGEDVGEYDITLALEGAKVNNYTVTFDAENDAFAITPATVQGVTLDDGSVGYDGMAHALEVTGTLPAGVTVSYTTDGEPRNSATDAGTYTVEATVSGDNYEPLVLEAELTIERAQPVITVAAEQTHVYDGTAKTVVATVVPAELMDQLQYSPRRFFTEVGKHEVRVYLNGSTNYLSAAAYTDFSITPASQEGMELADLTVTYDGQPHALEVTGAAADATVAYTINGEEGNSATDAGTYEVTAVVSRPNHADETLMGTLTINRAPAYILGEENQVHVYDGTAKTLAVELGHGEGELAYAPNNSFTEADTYVITVSAPQTDNYEAVSKTFTLRIDPATAPQPIPVTGITLDDATFTYDGMPKLLEITGTLPAGTLVSYENNSRTDVGTQTVTATISGDGYEMLVLTAELTVTKAAQTITFNAPQEVNRDAGTIPLEVSASSGLLVELSIDDEEVATLNGSSLNVLRLGTVHITATQAGDANHEAAGPVTVTVRVTDPTANLPVRVTKAVSPNGDGINEFLTIEGVKDYPDNRVSIFNRNGTVVWEGSGYNNGTVAFRGIGTGRNHVPAGTYFYVAEIRVGNEWKYEKGWFVLKY